MIISNLPVSVCSRSRALTRLPKLVFADRKSVMKQKMENGRSFV